MASTMPGCRCRSTGSSAPGSLCTVLVRPHALDLAIRKVERSILALIRESGPGRQAELEECCVTRVTCRRLPTHLDAPNAEQGQSKKSKLGVEVWVAISLFWNRGVVGNICFAGGSGPAEWGKEKEGGMTKWEARRRLSIIYSVFGVGGMRIVTCMWGFLSSSSSQLHLYTKLQLDFRSGNV
jgi:hypothetical protein